MERLLKTTNIAIIATKESEVTTRRVGENSRPMLVNHQLGDGLLRRLLIRSLKLSFL
jgi:hypothetical protein